MAIVTRQEFADMCLTSYAVVSTNITRKKIALVPGSKKMIDTENPLNKIFKKKQLQLERAKKAETTAVKKRAKVEEAQGFRKVIEDVFEEEDLDPELLDQIFTEEETPQQTRARQVQNKKDQEVVDWDLRKKMADAVNAERKAELAQIQIEKYQGNLMPVDMVEAILKVNIQDIFKTFENECVNLASIYCDIMAGGDREKLAEVTARIRVKLNETIHRIKINSAQEIENVIDSYAETRNRGERK